MLDLKGMEIEMFCVGTSLPTLDSQRHEYILNSLLIIVYFHKPRAQPGLNYPSNRHETFLSMSNISVLHSYCSVTAAEMEP